MIKSFLNPEGHQNSFSGSKVMAILLKGGFGLLVELQRGRVCPAACAAGLFLKLLLFHRRLHTLIWFKAGSICFNCRYKSIKLFIGISTSTFIFYSTPYLSTMIIAFSCLLWPQEQPLHQHLSLLDNFASNFYVPGPIRAGSAFSYCLN